MTNLQIRAENSEDFEAVYALNETAFKTDAEAKLVDKLRNSAEPYISLVAEIDGKIVGHIMLTPVVMVRTAFGVTLKTWLKYKGIKIMGLAPIAVLAAHQKTGIGSALIAAAFAICRDMQFNAVVVLGFPEYYPKFGFRSAIEFNIDSEFGCPPEYFMAVELQPDALKGKSGRVVYHQAFMEL